MDDLKCSCGRPLSEKDRMGGAFVCRACGKTTRLPTAATGLTPGPAADAMVSDLLRKAATGAEDPRAPSKATPGAVLFALLATLGGATGLVLYFDPRGDWRTILGFFLGSLSGVLGILGWGRLCRQILGPSIRRRGGPEEAVKAYLRMVDQGRWEAAAACLSWAAKDGQTVFRPALSPEALSGSAAIIRSAADLEQFWTGHQAGLLPLSFRRFAVRSPRMISDHVGQVPVDLDFVVGGSHAPEGSANVQKYVGDAVKVSLCLTLYAYSRDGQWYVLAAGPMEPRVVSS